MMFVGSGRLCPLLIVLLLPLFGSAFAPGTAFADEAPERKPWRLDDALRTPNWLTISGSHDTRYAYVFNQFRTGRGDDDRLLSVRTLLKAEARHEAWRIGAELIDARAYRMGDGNVQVSSAATTNPIDLLEAYVGYDDPSGKAWVRAGRFTLDLGSRRLVARHIYRNTINVFTGVEGEWRWESGARVRALFSLPGQRRPLDRDDVEDNKAEFDREDDEVVFWGAFGDLPIDALDSRLELYFYALHEDDTSDRATADRELYTPGFRLWRKPKTEQFDYEIETAFQFGSARGLRGATLNRQDRFAWFTHTQLGYTFDAKGKPRAIVEYSYASGDTNPNDGDDGRFDSLFGVQRPDFGPTEIYTAFVRTNHHAPGLRLELEPTDDTTAFVSYRAFWLASDKDAWTTAGVRDVTGDSGRFVGHHLDFRLRWSWIPGSVRFEVGAAWLLRGRFAHDAPNANNGGEPAVMYATTTIWF